MAEDNSQLYQALGRLEGKMDILLSNQSRQDRKTEEHERRLVELETQRHQDTGRNNTLKVLWMAFASLFGFLGSILKGLILP